MFGQNIFALATVYVYEARAFAYRNIKYIYCSKCIFNQELGCNFVAYNDTKHYSLLSSKSREGSK